MACQHPEHARRWVTLGCCFVRRTCVVDLWLKLPTLDFRVCVLYDLLLVHPLLPCYAPLVSHVHGQPGSESAGARVHPERVIHGTVADNQRPSVGAAGHLRLCRVPHATEVVHQASAEGACEGWQVRVARGEGVAS